MDSIYTLVQWRNLGGGGNGAMASRNIFVFRGPTYIGAPIVKGQKKLTPTRDPCRQRTPTERGPYRQRAPIQTRGPHRQGAHTDKVPLQTRTHVDAVLFLQTKALTDTEPLHDIHARPQGAPTYKGSLYRQGALTDKEPQQLRGPYRQGTLTDAEQFL